MRGRLSLCPTYSSGVLVVELIEYVIVFGISAGVAAASVAVVTGAAPGFDQVAAASKADQVAGAARLAWMGGGNVTVVLPLREASVSCQHGVLSTTIDGEQREYVLSLPCSFESTGLTGDCILEFSASHGSLMLEVSC